MRDQAFPLARLLVLSAVIVLAVTTELMPTGLLPQMSAGLHVSQSSIGLLVSLYALTVAITCVPLSFVTRRWRRHRLLAASAAVLGVTSLMAAFAPDYGTVLATRVIGALAHAVFWSTVGAYPAHVVSKERVGRAVGIVLAGATVGVIVGVPLATSIGHSLGWRFACAAIGTVLIAAAVAAVAFLPRVHHEISDHESSGAVSDSRPTRTSTDSTVRPALAVCFLALVIMIGHYAFYTYVSLYSTDVLGIRPSLISSVFLLIGIGEGVGLAIATIVFPRRTAAGILLSIAVAIVSVGAIAVLYNGHFWALAAVFLWSIALGILPVLLQTRLLHISSAAFRDRANALYTAMFNAGIGGGALVGAIVLSRVGLRALPWFYLGALVVSSLFFLVTRPVRLVDELES